jgi:hypothetical protein
MAGIETGRYQAIGVPPRLKFYLTTATQMSFDEPILEGEDDDDGPRLD